MSCEIQNAYIIPHAEKGKGKGKRRTPEMITMQKRAETQPVIAYRMILTNKTSGHGISSPKPSTAGGKQQREEPTSLSWYWCYHPRG